MIACQHKVAAVAYSGTRVRSSLRSTSIAKPPHLHLDHLHLSSDIRQHWLSAPAKTHAQSLGSLFYSKSRTRRVATMGDAAPPLTWETSTGTRPQISQDLPEPVVSCLQNARFVCVPCACWLLADDLLTATSSTSQPAQISNHMSRS